MARVFTRTWLRRKRDTAVDHENLGIRAFGPFPAERCDPESFCQALIDEHIPGFDGVFMFRESCTSFMQPVISLCETLDKFGGNTVIGSYSPTSGAAAIVEIFKTE